MDGRRRFAAMRSIVYIFVFTGVVSSLHTDDNLPDPEKLKAQITRFMDAANGGDWNLVASQSNLPSCYGGTICKTGEEIKSRVQTNSEGISRTLTKTELIQTATVKMRLPETSRKFVADGDTLVRIGYDERSKGNTTSNRCVLIFRPVRGELLLAGAISDPTPKEAK